jgi:hypothetical protein
MKSLLVLLAECSFELLCVVVVVEGQGSCSDTFLTCQQGLPEQWRMQYNMCCMPLPTNYNSPPEQLDAL